MDIGTGKDLDHFQWGIDLVGPDQPFSSSDYVNYAQKVLKDIWSRNKLPIIVGGTGLYIKELLEPSETLHIPPDETFRSKNFKLKELQKMLQKKDLSRWERMNKSDRQNPRRLVRAIEVAGKVDSGPGQNDWDVLIIGLTASYEFLYKRIDKRVEDRIAMGMEEERKKLSKYKLVNTIGYGNETVQEWKFAEHAYARRQMSYFKSKFKNTLWFDISRNDYLNEIVEVVRRWYIGGDVQV